MMKSFFIIVVFLVLFYSDSEAVTMEWYAGEVVLCNNQILQGDLNYDYRNEIIQCRQDGKIKAYSTHGVNSFSYLNTDTHTIHRFVAISEKNFENYRRKAFYEIVLEGDVYLLRKRNKALEPLRKGVSSDLLSLRTQILCFDYFVYQQGKITSLNKFKKKVLPILYDNTKFDKKISAYIEKRNLKLYYLVDQIFLIGYYNQLKFTEETAIKKTLTLN